MTDFPAAAWSPNEEERRKALLAYLLEAVAAIIWDNIPRDTVLPVKRWMLILAAPDMAERVGVLATVKDKAHCRARACGPP